MTNISEEPILTFDDLIRVTEADLVEAPTTTFWGKAVSILLWIPILLCIALVVLAGSVVVWWSIYGADALKGLLLLLTIFLEGAARS